MPRSLRVQPSQLNRYPIQRALAEEVALSLATVSNFLTGKPVDMKGKRGGQTDTAKNGGDGM
jgi:hypothetical protein